MQAVLDCDGLMADKTPEILRERIDAYEKKTDGLLSALKDDFHAIDKKLAVITTALKPRPKPWWLNFLVAPVIVLTIFGAGSELIYLHITVTDLQKSTRDAGGYIAGLRLQKTGRNPVDPKDLAEAREVLEAAKTHKIKIDQTVVEDVGKKFIEAGTNNSDSWNVALAFVDYRSYLNSRPPSMGNPSLVPTGQWTEVYNLSNILNAGKFKMASFGSAIPPDNAQFRPINTPDLNAHHPSSNAYIILQGALISLDNLYAKNVVIENSRIIYKGGSVVLYNVTFINCTFEVVRQPIGQEFAEKLLEPSSATNLQIG